MKVSVLLPVYDGARFLGQAIASALAQTHTDIEVVVSDDGSRDDTPAIIATYARDPRVKSVRGPNRGMVTALNRAWEIATGDGIVSLSHDDVLDPTSVATRLQLAEREGVPCASHGMRICDAELGKLCDVAGEPLAWERDWRRLAERNLTSGGVLYLHRALAEHIFPLPSELEFEDWWLTLAVLARTRRIPHTPAPLLHYRQHGGNHGGWSTGAEPEHQRTLRLWQRHPRYLEVMIANLGRLGLSAPERDALQTQLEDVRRLRTAAIDGELLVPSLRLIRSVGWEHYRFAQGLALWRRAPAAASLVQRARSRLPI